MAKKFIRTTSENFNQLSDKSEYIDSIVFIEDAKQIWSNNIYYGDIQILYDADLTTVSGGDEYFSLPTTSDTFLWEGSFIWWDDGSHRSLIPHTIYKVAYVEENGYNVWTPIRFLDKVIVSNINTLAETTVPTSLRYLGQDVLDYSTMQEYVFNGGLTSSYLTPKNKVGCANDTNKLYLIGTKSVSTSPQQSFSNSSIYATNGALRATLYNNTFGNIENQYAPKYSFICTEYDTTYRSDLNLIPLGDTSIQNQITQKLNQKGFVNGDIISILFTTDSSLYTGNGMLLTQDRLDELMQGACEFFVGCAKINKIFGSIYYSPSVPIYQANFEMVQSANQGWFNLININHTYLFKYLNGQFLLINSDGATNTHITYINNNTSGSTVSITPKITSGTLLAQCIINGNSSSIYQKNNTFTNSSSDSSFPILFRDSSSDSFSYLYNSNISINPSSCAINLGESSLRFSSGDYALFIDSSIVSIGTKTTGYVTIDSGTVYGNLQGNANTATKANYIKVNNSVSGKTAMRLAFINENTGEIHSFGNGYIAWDSNASNLIINAKSKGVTNSLTINNGSSTIVYDGSAKKSITIPQGTITQITAGTGLTGGSITSSGIIKANLKSTTAHTASSATPTNTASRQYAVGIDKDGYLSVNVPWTDSKVDVQSWPTDKALPVLCIDNDTNKIHYSSNFFITNPATSSSAVHFYANHYWFNVNNVDGAIFIGSDSTDTTTNHIISQTWTTDTTNKNTVSINPYGMKYRSETLYQTISIGSWPAKQNSCISLAGYSQSWNLDYKSSLHPDKLQIYNDNSARATIVTSDSITIGTPASKDPNIICNTNSYTKQNPLFKIETADGEVYGFFIDNNTRLEKGQEGFCNIVRLK